MAEKDSGDDRPSLEMPSLGFGRKRKRAAQEKSSPEEPAAPSAESIPSPEPEPTPVPDPTPEPAPEPERTEVLESVPPGATAPPLFADEVPVHDDERVVEPEAEDEDEAAAGARKERRQVSLPAIGGMAASMVVGAVVGLLTVGLTWASLRLCEVVQGTSSCGNPGFFLLLAIMVAMVLIGSVLLRAFGVVDPGSTSFLGVGLVAVVALLFLVDLLFLWWMVIAIPAVAVASFALAHWVTTAFIEPAHNDNLHR